MGWFSTNTRANTEKFKEIVNATKKKAGGNNKSSAELREKVEMHYNAAKGHVRSISNILMDLKRLKAKNPKVYSKKATYVALVDEHIMVAINELGKVFAYVIKTNITDKNSTSLHDIKGIVLDSMILFNNNNRLSNTNIQYKNMINTGLACPIGETISASICELCEEAGNFCPTEKKKEFDKMIPIMKELYDEANKKLEPLLPELPSLKRMDHIAFLDGGKRKTHRKTHNKKKTYMKLACKCTIRKARK